MINKLLLALLFVSLLSIAAQAQTLNRPTHRRWEISIFGGGSNLNDRSFQTPVAAPNQPPSRAVGLHYSSGMQVGLRLTENRWMHWGAAMEYSFSNQPLRFTNLSDALPSFPLRHSIHRLSYDVLYYPIAPSHRLRPFAFAGTGVSLFYVKSTSRDQAAANGIHLTSPWKLATRWGGGVKCLIRDQVAVSVQFTDNITGVPQYGMPSTGYMAASQYIAGFRPDGVLHNRMISVGFNYQLGGK